MANPNLAEVGVATRFKPGHSGRPKDCPPISKARARKLAKAAIVAEVMGKRPPDFEGDALEYLQAAYRGEITPDPLRMQAAAQALKFERPALAAVMTKNVDTAPPSTSAALDEQIMALLRKGLGNVAVIK